MVELAAGHIGPSGSSATTDGISISLGVNPVELMAVGDPAFGHCLRTDEGLFRVRREQVWLGLLALAELADLVTTRFGMRHGTLEANPIAAWLLSRGLLEMVKIAAVVSMVLVAVLVIRFAAKADPTRGTSVRNWAVRGMQLSVGALTIAALANLGMWAIHAARTGSI